MVNDLIVVGAGSAGAVIAARVTEDPSKRVLVLEAGPHYEDQAVTPGDLLDGRKNSVRAHDWGFSYLPGALRSGVLYPRGKVTGGSSAVNTCIALRGQPYDYDEWADLGCPEWSYSKCLPAFIRLETDHDIHSAIHGREGPLPIRRARPSDLVPIQRAFLEACAELGFPACADHNDPETTGYGPHPMNRLGDTRVSTSLAYLVPASRRANLSVRPGTMVNRVILGNGRVQGIEIEQGGVIDTIPCSRVVLSAGSIQTPAILVRSGIGPREVLERLGIPVVVDLPAVGARLLDHPGALIALMPAPGAASFDHPIIQTTLRFTSKGSRYPNDMQLQPLSFLQVENLPLLMGISTVVGKPRSIGRLVFGSADPRVQPSIEPNLLGDDDDLERITEGLELALRAAQTPPIAALGMPVWPDAEVLGSRGALMQWARANCGSGYHPSGTVPMGGPGDPAAALDQYGRVRGVDGLVVADASIMPTITSSNTNLPTIMIGERFGEWLREGLLG